jgi:hypothetical protein
MLAGIANLNCAGRKNRWVLSICYDDCALRVGAIGGRFMLRQLHQLTIPTAISIAFFDATFLIIAHVFAFDGHEVLLGVAAGAAGGLYVLLAVLWQGARKTAGKVANAPQS